MLTLILLIAFVVLIDLLVVALVRGGHTEDEE